MEIKIFINIDEIEENDMSMRFGLQIEPQSGFNCESVENIALECEKSGYDGIWVSDHFFLNDKSEKPRNCRR